MKPIEDFDSEEDDFWTTVYSDPNYWKQVEEQERQRARAREVIKELTDGLPDFPDFEDPEKNQELYQLHLQRLNALIKSNLDAKSIWEFVFLAGDLRDSAKGKIRAQKRHSLDPKQMAKQNVRECWELWKKESSRYKSKSAFARDMLAKFEDLESQRVIERWCKEWESEPS